MVPGRPEGDAPQALKWWGGGNGIRDTSIAARSGLSAIREQQLGHSDKVRRAFCFEHVQNESHQHHRVVVDLWQTFPCTLVTSQGDDITVKAHITYTHALSGDKDPYYMSDPESKYKCTEVSRSRVCLSPPVLLLPLPHYLVVLLPPFTISTLSSPYGSPQQSDGSWFCEKQNKTVENPMRRYIFPCTLSDHTGNHLVTLFDEAATVVMNGITADQIDTMKNNQVRSWGCLLACAVLLFTLTTPTAATPPPQENEEIESCYKAALFVPYLIRLKVKQVVVWSQNTHSSAPCFVCSL